MFNKYLFFVIIVIITSCGQTSPSTDVEIPNDLDSLRDLKRNVSLQVRKLNSKLEDINKKIEEISPKIENSAILITTDTLENIDFNHYVKIQSSIQSEDVANISSELGGRITSLPIKEGQRVRKGQILSRVDITQYEKQMSELETQLTLARDIHKRQSNLWDQKIGSEIQYLQAKNNVERLEKSKASLRNLMNKTSVYSPMDGIIEKIINKVGEVTAPGHPIVKIINVNNLKVVADLPENYLTAVITGDQVEVYIPAIDRNIQGRVSFVGQVIDPSNRTFKVEVKIKNIEGVLKPNLLAEMIINDYTIKDVIQVPVDLVQQEVGGKNFIYSVIKIDDKLKAQKNYVKLGESGKNLIVITEGLKSKDIVVVEGAFNVTEDDVVIIQPK